MRGRSPSRMSKWARRAETNSTASSPRTVKRSASPAATRVRGTAPTVRDSAVAMLASRSPATAEGTAIAASRSTVAGDATR